MRVLRQFALVRDIDESGVSGTGHVADGVQFPNGWCAMVWRTKTTSAAFYESISDLRAIHAHGGKTRIVWRDHCSAAFRDSEQGPGWVIECVREPDHAGYHYCHETGIHWTDGIPGAIAPDKALFGPPSPLAQTSRLDNA